MGKQGYFNYDPNMILYLLNCHSLINVIHIKLLLSLSRDYVEVKYTYYVRRVLLDFKHVNLI